MDVQELLVAFEDGLKANSWKLMAIAVQAIPEGALKGMIDTSSLATSLTSVFKQAYKMSSDSWVFSLSDQYPFYYAQQKLRLGRSDCVKEAISAAEEAFGLTAPPILHTYDHRAIYAGTPGPESFA